MLPPDTFPESSDLDDIESVSSVPSSPSSLLSFLSLFFGAAEDELSLFSARTDLEGSFLREPRGELFRVVSESYPVDKSIKKVCDFS